MIRALRIGAGFVLAFVVLTCTDEQVAGPTRPGALRLDLRGLTAPVASGQPDIPLDSIRVTFRPAGQSAIAFDTTIAPVGAQVQGDSAVLQLKVRLSHSPEDFDVDVEAFGADIRWYQLSTTLTINEGANPTPAPFTATYVGPGSNATRVQVRPADTTAEGGTPFALHAVVYDGANAPIPGVPVGYRLSDSTRGSITTNYLTATLVGATNVRDSVWLVAETPTHLKDSTRLHLTPPAATLQKVSGDPQSGPIGVAFPQPLVVRVLDALGAPYKKGKNVTWSVTAGAASLSLASTTSDTAGNASVTLTPTASGSITVQAASSGLTGSPATFTATGTSSAATAIAKDSGDAQTDTVGRALARQLVVRVTDASANPVSGTQVAWTVVLGGGAPSFTTTVTDAAGRARVTFTLGQTAGPNSITATVVGLAPVTFSATGVAGQPASVTKISGDNQIGAGGAALSQPLVVEARDGFANLVPSATVTWATTGGGSLAPASGPTGVNGRAQSTWTLGPSAPTQTATATVGALTPVSFSATANIGTPAISLSFAGIPGVGIGLSATVNVSLNAPAGAGGVSVDVTSQNTNFVTVTGSPVLIPQGQTAGTVTINGGAAGTTTITGQATGYTSGVLSIDVQSRAIALPLTINVPYGQTTQIPVQIGAVAPAGGVDVSVVSSAPSFVAVQSSPVHINAGGLTANATLIGVLPGSAVITASNPAYNFATSTATTSASLNIVQASATLNASFGASITINFESNGQPTAAPSPGITVNLTAVTPACLAVPASVTIATGFVSTTAPLTYGGGPITLPCFTKLLATATNLLPDSINTVTVNPVPAITLSTPAQGTGRLGIGLQDQGSGSLQFANPGPGSLTVHLVSSDAAVLLLAPDASTTGTSTLDVQVPINQNGFSYFIQGVGVGTATITASAPSYTSGTSPTVTATTPGFDILGLPSTTTSLSANDAFFVRLGAPNAANTALAAEQSLRAGATAVTATVRNRTPSVAQLVTTATTGQQVTVSIVAGQARSPSTKTAGGVEYDPLGAGPDTVTATIPGFVIFPGTADSVPVTVTAPLITMSTPAQGTGRLGVGLQDQGSGSLQVANPGPGSLTVHLVSSDPAVLLLAPDAATAGTPTLDVQVPILQSGFSYFIQGVATGTATVTASAPAYTNGTSPTVTVATPGFDILGLTTATTSLAANDAFFVRLGVPNAPSTALAAEQSLRAGSSPLTVSVHNRTPSAAQLVTTALTGQTVTVSIVAGQARSPSTLGAGGVEYDPLGAGADTVTASILGFVIFPGTADSVPVTVTAPLITMSTPAQGTGRLGVGLQDQGGGSLQTANPGPGPLTVHLVSSNPSALLLAPDAATAGTPTLDVQVPINQSSFSYFIQGIGTGTATITASAPAYVSGTSPTVTVATPGFDILGLTTSTTSLAANDAFFVRLGVPNAANTALAAEQSIRFGGSTVTATIKNRLPAAAQLVTMALTGNTVTVQIPAQQARSPSTVATGGVEYDPLGAGSDTVTASIPGFVIFPGTADSVPVTVTAPLITMSTPAQGTGRLGAGLQDQGSGSLQTANPGPGPLTVHLVSSQPSVLLLAPNATTLGTPTLDVQVPANQSGFSYTILGLEGTSGTVTITASASGYTNGTAAVTVAQPGFDILGLSSAITTLAGNDAFFVRLGVPNVGNTALAAEQSIRIGGNVATATVRNKNTTAAQLVTAPLTGQVVTVQVAIGQARSPSTVALGGVEYDPLAIGLDTVSASIPGFVSFQGAPDSVAVSVTAPLITMSTPAQGTGRLGVGLQDQGSGSLQTANPGPSPLTVHLVSSDPTALLLAPNATTPGTSALDVQVPVNQSGFTYFIQGVATGSATITASAPAYVNGTSPAVTVVTPGFDILSLVTSISSTAANDPFLIRLGAPNATNTALAAEQSVSAAGSPVTATITSTSSTAGQLVTTATTGLTVDVTIGVGQARSASTVVAGGVEFDPLAQGTTTVSATIPTYVAMPSGSVIVNVTP